MKNSKVSVVAAHDKIMSELYSLYTLINMTRNYCQELEFKGEYYGGSHFCVEKFSKERNEYLTMMSLMSNKLDDVITLNLNIERELLQQNANYSSR